MRKSPMIAVVCLLVSGPLALAACGASDDQYAQDPSQSGYPAQPQGSYTGYPQQGYPQQTYPQQTTPQTYPAATATTTATAPATIIPIPCQADSGCGLNKCNLTTQTCAPCATAADCTSGTCTFGVCLPGATQ